MDWWAGRSWRLWQPALAWLLLAWLGGQLQCVCVCGGLWLAEGGAEQGVDSLTCMTVWLPSWPARRPCCAGAWAESCLE